MNNSLELGIIWNAKLLSSIKHHFPTPEFYSVSSNELLKVKNLWNLEILTVIGFWFYKNRKQYLKLNSFIFQPVTWSKPHLFVMVSWELWAEFFKIDLNFIKSISSSPHTDIQKEGCALSVKNKIKQSKM